MILDTSSSIDLKRTKKSYLYHLQRCFTNMMIKYFNPTLANVNRFKSGQKYPKNIRLPNFESKSLERY